MSKSSDSTAKGLWGVDQACDWGCSKHDGWVHGYSFEVVVSAARYSLVFPLLASAGVASAKETTTFEPKLDDLPGAAKYVAADSGYDSNHVAERIEYTTDGKRTGRRFLCPENKRSSKVKSGRQPVQPRNEPHRGHCQTAEPFNEWFKALFELDDRVWHRGLENNQIQLLAALFAYRLLVRYNHRAGIDNGQMRWILDSM